MASWPSESATLLAQRIVGVLGDLLLSLNKPVAWQLDRRGRVCVARPTVLYNPHTRDPDFLLTFLSAKLYLNFRHNFASTILECCQANTFFHDIRLNNQSESVGLAEGERDKPLGLSHGGCALVWERLSYSQYIILQFGGGLVY